MAINKIKRNEETREATSKQETTSFEETNFLHKLYPIKPAPPVTITFFMN